MTDRWHPASTYSASVRDQPSVEADNQGAPASSASTQSRSITISASPKMSRQHRSSDIPVHPDLLHNRLSSDLTVVSPDLLLVIPSAQTAESSRKRRASANQEAQQTDLTKSTKQQRPSLSENRCDRPSDGLSSTLASQGDSKNEGQHKQDVQPSKPKPTRGSRACTVCRRLKMRCTDAENGPPCRRCRLGKHQCIFEESQRGKKGTKRTDLLAKNLQTVEEKLDAVMSKMQNHVNSVDAVVGTPVSPLEYSTQTHKGSVTYGLPNFNSNVSCDPENGSENFQKLNFDLVQVDQSVKLMNGNFSRNLTSSQPQPLTRFAALPDFSRPSSPRLHSLPDNTLNPLGLLAEASLRNRHDRQRSDRSSNSSQHRNLSGSQHNTRKSSSNLMLESKIDSKTGETHSPPSSISSSCASLEQAGSEGGDNKNSPRFRTGKTHKKKVGVANQSYFQPGPANIFPLRRIVIEQKVPPSLLTDKILTSDEAVELFKIFFEKCNPHCCILEQTLHTPAMVGSRSPFLFTAICAVASRYYEKRNELHLNCLQAAKRIAFDVMVKGYKSVEVVQAFVLLSHWNQPAERFEEDRTWAFSGIAIRMAIDLNLHRKTTLQLPLAKRCTNLIAHSVESYQSDEASSSQQADMYEREILNRERTWLYCFILDRSLSAQMGKPYSIREDFIIRSSKDWHKQRCSVPEDAGITAMVDLHRIHSRILDTLYSDTCSNSGLNANLDYSLLMKTFSQSLDQWMTECMMKISTSPYDLPGGYRFVMKDFYYNYYRLFTMSFMLQHTLENPDKKIELPQVYVTCYDAASRVITIARDQLGPLGVLRYASDNQFVYIAYAAVFLLKLIRPQFQFFCDRLVVRNLVHDCTVLLDQVSVDETHTPALYASFLRLLLRSKNESSSDFNVVSHKEELESHAVKAVHSGGTESQFVEQSNEKKREELYVLNKDSTGDRQAEENFSRESIEFLEPLVDSKTSLPAETATAQMHSPGGVERSLPENLMDLDQRMNQGTNFQELQQQHPANDCFVDSLLKDGGFWDSMLMPGYSGPLDALSGGAGLVSHFGNNIFEQSNCFSFNTPSGSGRASPNQYNFLNQSTK